MKKAGAPPMGSEKEKSAKKQGSSLFGGKKAKPPPVGEQTI